MRFCYIHLFLLNYLRFFGINYYLFLLSVSGLLLVSSRTRLANYPKFRAFILFSSPMMQHCTRQGRVRGHVTKYINMADKWEFRTGKWLGTFYKVDLAIIRQCQRHLMVRISVGDYALSGTTKFAKVGCYLHCTRWPDPGFRNIANLFAFNGHMSGGLYLSVHFFTLLSTSAYICGPLRP